MAPAVTTITIINDVVNAAIKPKAKVIIVESGSIGFEVV